VLCICNGTAATEIEPPASETFLQAGADAYSQPTQGVNPTLATFLDAGGLGAAAPRQDAWEEALHKDMLLARVLLGRGATSQDRLRECRELQLQHRLRLGVILVKKGYVDRPTVEAAIQEVVRSFPPAASGH